MLFFFFFKYISPMYITQVCLVFTVLSLSIFFLLPISSLQIFYVLFVGLVAYWTITIFIFIFKRYSFASYTSVIQRYWKRTLNLFWSLEVFLFAIYVYLVLNVSTEVEWLLDQPSNFLNVDSPFSELYIGLLVSTLAIYIATFLVRLLGFSDFHSPSYMLLILLSVILVLLSGEFFGMVSLNTIYLDISIAMDWDKGYWEVVSDNYKFRTLLHYTWLIAVLKFWHIVFIVVVFMVIIMFYNQKGFISFDNVAALKQNVFFLLLFSLVPFIVLIKRALNIIYADSYVTFYVSGFFSDLALYTSSVFTGFF